MKIAALLSSSLVLLGACSHAQVPALAPGEAASSRESPWQQVASFTEPKLAEISGLASSPISKDLLWAHNDSGGEPEIHALDLNGTFLGSVTLLDVKNKDWEDLCGFRLGNKPYLLIADTGDNKRKRLSVPCHVIAEPSPNDKKTKVAWTQTIRYQDGPQDCESVAVYEDQIFLLNKDSGTSVIYQAPLGSPNKSAVTVVAKKLVVLPQVNNAASSLTAVFKAGFLGSKATALDISADGQWAAVLTYTDVRLFKRKGKEPWKAAFVRKPQVIALPKIYQPEALCFSADSQSLYVSSEESPTPIVRFNLKTD